MFKWIPASHPVEAQETPREILTKGTQKEARSMDRVGETLSKSYSVEGYFGKFGGHQFGILQVIINGKLNSYEIYYFQNGDKKVIKEYYAHGIWDDIFKKISSLRSA